MNIIDLWLKASSSEKLQILTIVVALCNVAITSALTVVNICLTAKRARKDQKSSIESNYYLPTYLHLQEFCCLYAKALHDDSTFAIPINLFLDSKGPDSEEIRAALIQKYRDYSKFREIKSELYYRHIDKELDRLNRHISEVLNSKVSSYVAICKTIFTIEDFTKTRVLLERLLYKV